MKSLVLSTSCQFFLRSIGATTANPCRSRCQHSRRRGAAVVEFALVAPIFFVLVFGILEIGRLVMVQQLLTTASREGARIAITEGATVSGVQSSVASYLAGASVSGATVTVTPASLSTAQPGDTIVVGIQIPFDSVSWVPSPWFVKNTTMTASSSMRREGIP
jgi:TadE-like protein